MQRRLDAVLALAERHPSCTTLPVTAAAVRRHPDVLRPYAERGIEFAVHGYHHVDHTELPPATQVAQLRRARNVLRRSGLRVAGFRAPYLRANAATMRALSELGYLYDSSQAMHWPVPDELETDGYRRALSFYSSLAAMDHVVVPRIEDGLVRIPVCLPDDETVVERLALDRSAISALWLEMESATHDRGDLLTLQVHPERIDACGPGVASVLAAAASRAPRVWMARLDEIARWWLERAGARVDVEQDGPGSVGVEVVGPDGLTLLARNVDVAGAEPWGDGYVRVPGRRVRVRTARRPVVGVHPSSPPTVGAFLLEQGYVVERGVNPEAFGAFVDRRSFARSDERSLLAEIEGGDGPLVRLGRWPNGARSAVSLTGDVDALTLWDYALRFAGR